MLTLQQVNQESSWFGPKAIEPRKRFFSGYYKDPDATEEGWRGGWWHTGDVVREGDDGCLYFVDRRKNVIRRSGENIAAVEVEAVLLRHPDVLGCAVCAVPDEMRGDEVFAFIISQTTADAPRYFRPLHGASDILQGAGIHSVRADNTAHGVTESQPW